PALGTGRGLVCFARRAILGTKKGGVAMHLHETDPAPRWPQGPGRTAAQRAAAVFLLAAGPASAAYWAPHGLPDGAPMPTPLLLCLLAMTPVGLWLLLACPPLRPQRPDELAVFHAGWSAPVG